MGRLGRRSFAGAVLVAVLGFGGPSVASEERAGEPVGTITSLGGSGALQVEPAGGTPQPAAAGQTLLLGDRLIAGEGVEATIETTKPAGVSGNEDLVDIGGGKGTAVTVSRRGPTTVAAISRGASLLRSGETAERAAEETKTKAITATIHVTEEYYPSGACSSGASVLLPIVKNAISYSAIVLDDGKETTVTHSPPFNTEGVPAGHYGAGLAGYNASAGSCAEVAAGYRARFQVKSATVTVPKKVKKPDKGDDGGGGKGGNLVGTVRNIFLAFGEKGRARAQIFKDGRWQPLRQGDDIGIGDRLRTGENSEMIVEFDLGGRIAMKKGSEVRITGERSNERTENGRWKVTKGGVWTKCGQMKTDLEVIDAGGNPIVMSIKG